MPRFLHIQPNGKWRPIDDGRRYAHNQATGYVESLDCVIALQPAVHLATLMKVLQRHGYTHFQIGQLQAETGLEDIPHAYRWVPNAPNEEHVNVVAVYCTRDQEWKFQVVYGQVFEEIGSGKRCEHSSEYL